MKKIEKILTLLIVGSILVGCAQYVPPTGGKKDIIPPKLISTIPSNKSLNFKGKQIELYFDELIDVTSLRQELLIFPEPDGTYEYKAKSNGVVLKFSKPFKDSTTYTLNFRNGVKDLNEKNNTKNLKLIFSTGNKIDSVSIEGKVSNLLTNKVINEATVALYQITDTLDIRKVKPTYFYKTDTSGLYKFENTKIGNYKMFAFTDKNNNLRYDPKNELIAFYKDTLKLRRNISQLNFKMYMVDTLRPKVQKLIPRGEEYIVQYSEGIKTAKINFENPKDSIPYVIEEKIIKFYNVPVTSDTLKVKISVTDSSNNVFSYLQKVNFREIDKNQKKRKPVAIKPYTKPLNGEDVENEFSYALKFENPIIKFDKDKVKILSDTITKEQLDDNNYQWNKTKNELKINKKISAQREVKVEFDKGAFIDLKGDSSAKVVNKHIILDPENYGLLEGRIEGEKSNKIIQLIDESFKVLKEVRTPEKFLFKNIKPGIYFARIIMDANNNGAWDFGDLKKEIMPEQVIIVEKPFNIKANFELTGQVISTKQEKVNSK